jgi:apolipoprotein N-acyltransferase
MISLNLLIVLFIVPWFSPINLSTGADLNPTTRNFTFSLVMLMVSPSILYFLYTLIRLRSIPKKDRKNYYGLIAFSWPFWWIIITLLVDGWPAFLLSIYVPFLLVIGVPLAKAIGAFVDKKNLKKSNP